jgi:hypothetical protein
MSKGGVLLLLLIIAAIGFSFYRGYLVFSSRHQPTTNNTELNLTVDQNKAQADANQAGAEMKKLTEKIDLNPAD